MILLAVDGNSILNRAFYAIRMLSTKDGRFTNGIYGFMNILLNQIDAYKPDAIAVAFDLKGPTFRHEIYKEYKAGRRMPPTELVEQFQPLNQSNSQNLLAHLILLLQKLMQFLRLGL